MKLANPAFDALRAYATAMPASSDRFVEVRLASNENPYGTSQRALAAITQELAGLHRYPDPGTHRLRAKLAQHHGLSADHFVVGNGANELLELIAHTFLGPEQNTVHADPSFIVYTLAPLARGIETRGVPMRNGYHDLDAMLDAVDDQTKLLFLANPNNPTGTHVGHAALARFIRALPEHVVLVIDEAYLEYATAPDMPHGIDFLPERERLIILKTLSKAYGLAGIRVGYAIAPPPLIELINRGRQPFNVSSLAQTAAVAALSDTAHLTHSVHANEEERTRITRELSAMGCSVTPSQTNFVLVDLGCDAGPILHAMAMRGVIVRSMAPYGLRSSLRISIGTPLENDLCLRALHRALGRDARMVA